MTFYRPPPAQAQAQPAQAQAHAQAQPLPPLRPLLYDLPLLAGGFGGGLVMSVIPLVKSLMLPTTFDEKFCTPSVIPAAKSDPGRCGRERLPPGVPELTGLEVGLPKLGSYRGHHTGT